jgi:3-hydroxyacyl-[acyl-carrier-protein] dehydratase
MDTANQQGRVPDLDIERIRAMIPHRYPMLMIDRVVEIVPDESAVGIKNVSNNEPYFAGHFPQRPVMPGVLIIEALAQTGGLLMSKSWEVDSTNKIIFFMSVDHCRFRHPVRPGDVLKLHVEVARARGDVVKFRGRGLVGEKVACEAEFAAMMVETPQ